MGMRSVNQQRTYVMTHESKQKSELSAWSSLTTRKHRSAENVIQFKNFISFARCGKLPLDNFAAICKLSLLSASLVQRHHPVTLACFEGM